MFALLFIENQIPKVTGTLRINATVNQPVELFAEATDADKETVTIYFIGSITGQNSSQQNATYSQSFIPDQMTNYEIRYIILKIFICCFSKYGMSNIIFIYFCYYYELPWLCNGWYGLLKLIPGLVNLKTIQLVQSNLS